jgi:hypothetical protein
MRRYCERYQEQFSRLFLESLASGCRPTSLEQGRQLEVMAAVRKEVGDSAHVVQALPLGWGLRSMMEASGATGAGSKERRLAGRSILNALGSSQEFKDYAAAPALYDICARLQEDAGALPEAFAPHLEKEQGHAADAAAAAPAVPAPKSSAAAETASC